MRRRTGALGAHTLALSKRVRSKSRRGVTRRIPLSSSRGARGCAEGREELRGGGSVARTERRIAEAERAGFGGESGRERYVVGRCRREHLAVGSQKRQSPRDETMERDGQRIDIASRIGDAIE